MKRKKPVPTTWMKRFRRGWWGSLKWVVRHEFYLLTRYIGLRDRLRCPLCKKVGTWKPHKPPRRWLCKWCGAYVDVKRYGVAAPCAIKKVWMLKPLKATTRPQQRVGALDPWRG